jgi:opacity protein-like surface antigen
LEKIIFKIKLYKEETMYLQKNKICCLVLLLPSLVHATDKPHDIFLHFDAGASLSNNLEIDYRNDMGSSALLGLGLKYQLAPQVKLGASFSHRPGYNYKYINKIRHSKTMKESQKFKISTLMANASYDIIKAGNKIIPYVEVGLGVARIKQENFIISYTTHKGKTVYNPTVNGGFGLNFELSDKSNMAIAYKYNYFGKIKQVIKLPPHTDVNEGELSAHEFIVSFVFKI